MAQLANRIAIVTGAGSGFGEGIARAYVAEGAKGAVNIISKSMVVELGPEKIRVNAICPVIGETGLLTQFMGGPDTPENRARFLATIPLGRFSHPRDVAAAAVFLAQRCRRIPYRYGISRRWRADGLSPTTS
jgi:NAD(P)-dependent dehydrogenase (short-subunit alcohol dehydrogenase family)